MTEPERDVWKTWNMRRAQAEPLIVLEWRGWASQHIPPGARRTGDHALTFFGYLQSDRSWLLDFGSNGDKWQDVHTMLLARLEVDD